MWGNSLGWWLSACWTALVIAAVLVAGHLLDATAPRTSFSADASHAALLNFTTPPQRVIAIDESVPAAGPIYRRAIEAYQQNVYVYDGFARHGMLVDLPDVPALSILAEAIGSSQQAVFADRPSEIVNTDSEKPPVMALLTLGQCAVRASLLVEPSGSDQALKHARAAFALGSALCRERLAYAEYDAGLTLLAGSAKMIQTIEAKAGHTEAAEVARQFDLARQALYTERVQPTLRVIGSVDERVLALHAGDVFYFARRAEERMWRVEAILKLGRYRFNAARIGDQRAAERSLKELSNDPDPIIVAAVRAASEMTIEQFRMLH